MQPTTPLDELGAQITAAGQAWYTFLTKYSDALRVLPDLIVHSERTVHEYDRSGSLEVALKGCEALEPLLPDGTPSRHGCHSGEAGQAVVCR
ncbi:MAG: hypothetical protein ACRDTF_22835 [Pseudonocardiaceae bacterium]